MYSERKNINISFKKQNTILKIGLYDLNFFGMLK